MTQTLEHLGHRDPKNATRVTKDHRPLNDIEVQNTPDLNDTRGPKDPGSFNDIGGSKDPRPFHDTGGLKKSI